MYSVEALPHGDLIPPAPTHTHTHTHTPSPAPHTPPPTTAHLSSPNLSVANQAVKEQFRVVCLLLLALFAADEQMTRHPFVLNSLACLCFPSMLLPSGDRRLGVTCPASRAIKASYLFLPITN